MPRSAKAPAVKNNATATAKAPATAPATVQHKEVAVAQTKPSLAQTFKEGLAFGAGSSIAQTLIRSISRSAEPVPPTTESKEYKQCMSDNNDKAACAHLLVQ
jgi:hypothetical protein